MRVVGLPRSFYYTGKHPAPVLNPTAQLRWRMVSSWQALRAQGLSSTKASEVLRLPRATLYRWAGKLASQGPQGLEEQSRGPHHRRQPTWSPQLALAVLHLRETYPRWGKDKLVVLLRRQGGDLHLHGGADPHLVEAARAAPGTVDWEGEHHSPASAPSLRRA